MLGSTKYIVNKVKTHLVQSYAYYKPVLLDTGSTHQFFSIDSSPPSTVPIVNVQPTKNGIQVLLPNHEIIQALTIYSNTSSSVCLNQDTLQLIRVAIS